MRTKRAVRIIVVTCLVCCVVALFGCSAKDDGAAVALDAQLAALKTHDMVVIEEYREAGMFDPQDYGVSVEAFADCCFDGFSYEVGESETHDDFTAVEVALSVCDQTQMIASLEAARDAALDEGADAMVEGFADPWLYELYEQEPWERHELSATVPMRQDAETGEWLIIDKGGLCASLLDGYDMRQILS